MVRALLAAGVLVVASTASAEDEVELARGYVDHSTTIYLANTWTPGPTIPVRIGLEGAARLTRSKLAFEARVGLGGVASLNALGSELHGHFGLSIGVALPLTNRLAMTPMVGYDVFALWEKEGGNFAVHYVMAEIPLSILVFEHVMIEPFIQLGIARFQGATDPAVVIGPRIGLTF
ncbi:MAG: hypothetical protein SFX73_24905 [Kofleriaceae bacterium]|nr:hypothetical protein [Kofleriaceae bacterium]